MTAILSSDSMTDVCFENIRVVIDQSLRSSVFVYLFLRVFRSLREGGRRAFLIKQ